MTKLNTQVLLLDALPQAPHLDAQDRAMLQALYSRSGQSVLTHLEKVDETGSAKFMQQYYTGYGHDSIGDCGNITIFFEGVSMLAAKAIQDTSLYNGQESSTRYIDFSSQPFRTHDGTQDDTSDWHKIHEGWRAIYLKVQAAMLAKLRADHPFVLEGDADEKTHKRLAANHERALNARAFDVARGFLPAGATTQLAWSGTITHVRDRLNILGHHPLQEVRELAEAGWNACRAKYPESFPELTPETADDRTKALHEYLERASAYTYMAADPQDFPQDFPQFDAMFIMDTETAAAELGDLLTNRPKFSKLPTFTDVYGHMHVTALLDFASFRDIQRHRAGTCRMPLLTGDFGMHSWYFDQLDPEVRRDVQGDIGEVFANMMSAVAEAQKADDSSISHEGIQYYIPMAALVPVQLAYGLREAIYVSELRSGATVHPTLRILANKMGDALLEEFPQLQLHLDKSEDAFCVKRGQQTITKADGTDLDTPAEAEVTPAETPTIH